MSSIIPTYKPHDSQIVKVISEGKYGQQTKQEFEKQIKWDILKEKCDEAHSFDGFLKGRIKVARFEGNEEVSKLLEFLLNRYKDFERKGIVNLKRYRGEKNIQIIYQPNKILVKKYAKKNIRDKSSIEEQEYLFQKDEINAVISAINICKNINPNKIIKTSQIEEQYCKMMNLKETKYGEQLFDNNGNFIYSHFIRWRIAHYRITLILNILQDCDSIEYNKLGTKVLKNPISIQEVLP